MKIEIKKRSFLRILLESWYYMCRNVYFYLFSKKKVDKQVTISLSNKISDKVIVVAVHGFFEYYWQSFTDYMNYFNKKGKVLIPIGFNYFDKDSESIKNIFNQIEEIHKKTNKDVVIIADSLGAFLVSRQLYKESPKYIKEFIPLAGMYGVMKGVTFWGYWITKTPRKVFDFYNKKFAEDKIPKTNIALYGKYDVFVFPPKSRILKTSRNIGFDTGHFGILYDLEVIKFVYNYIFDKNE